MHSRFRIRFAQLLAAGAAAAVAVVLAAGPAMAAPRASGSPTTGLKNGSVVSLTASGFPANSTIFILECSGPSQSACAVSKLQTTKSSGSGSVSAAFTVFTGAVGDGTCDAGSTNCFLALSTGTEADSASVQLSFAGGSTPSAAPTTAPASATSGSRTPGATAPVASGPSSSAAAGSTPTTGASLGAGTTPSQVSAGSGGLADQHGPDPVLIALVCVAGVLLLGGTGLFLRGRR